MMTAGIRLGKGKTTSVRWKQCDLLLLATTCYVDEPPCAVFYFSEFGRAINANAETNCLSHSFIFLSITFRDSAMDHRPIDPGGKGVSGNLECFKKAGPRGWNPWTYASKLPIQTGV
jgi:hypothetical protein